MEGIGVVRFYKDNQPRPTKEVLTNLTELIIKLFGGFALQIYGIS